MTNNTFQLNDRVNITGRKGVYIIHDIQRVRGLYWYGLDKFHHYLLEECLLMLSETQEWEETP